MATINASTTHSVKKKLTAPTPSAAAPPKVGISGTGIKKKATAPTVGHRGSVAPLLKPSALAHPTAVAALQQLNKDEKVVKVRELLAQALGAATVSARNLSAPHAASTTRDRGAAAADLAVATKHLSVPFVLIECGILAELQRNLFPDGIETLLTRGGDNDNDSTKSNNNNNTNSNTHNEAGSGLKPSTSAVSLSSLVGDWESVTGDGMTTTTANNSVATDSRRGKTSPPAAREGCLLILRALCERLSSPTVEPYICGAFLAAALDECASANSSVREAASDCVTALGRLVQPWAYRTVVAPILLQSLQCTEWRVKVAALEAIIQMCARAPNQVHRHIPTLIPACASQVWDTKPQVSKGAKSALLAICETNINTDIRPAISAIVNAICKPSETNKAVSELMGTTFVVPVDASTLAILCPVLARALKEKLALHKRAACIVISNMSKLVDSPASIAPFGSLLVPELQKVAANVQFEEIRDESLKALTNLTKALGDQYRNATEENTATTSTAAALLLDRQQQEATLQHLQQEQLQAEMEQLRIQQEREELAAQEERHRQREREERQRFKEAMDAQRRLEQMAEDEAAVTAAAEQQRREMLKLSTRAEGGQCQGCGLKKCKKTCMFYVAAATGN